MVLPVRSFSCTRTVTPLTEIRPEGAFGHPLAAWNGHLLGLIPGFVTPIFAPRVSMMLPLTDSFDQAYGTLGDGAVTG